MPLLLDVVPDQLSYAFDRRAFTLTADRSDQSHPWGIPLYVVKLIADGLVFGIDELVGREGFDPQAVTEDPGGYPDLDRINPGLGRGSHMLPAIKGPGVGLETKLPGCVTHVRFFFFNDTATTEIYTLSLHDALPI